MHSLHLSKILRTWPSTKTVTRHINSLSEIASDYDAIIFDQWGVLHNGTRAYPDAIQAIAGLRKAGIPLAVLSNSGKRAAPNADRITQMGFAPQSFDVVMTSGEALWMDVAIHNISAKSLYPIERAPGDAMDWASGLELNFTDTIAEADAVLLMGLPDGSGLDEWRPLLEEAHKLRLPVYCSNPDRASPRAGGVTVTSPGALGYLYRGLGGETVFYGKPHLPIFQALQANLQGSRFLMVGDSLEHDIAGAHAAGWDSLLIQGGLYAKAFSDANTNTALSELCTSYDVRPPTFTTWSVS